MDMTERMCVHAHTHTHTHTYTHTHTDSCLIFIKIKIPEELPNQREAPFYLGEFIYGKNDININVFPNPSLPHMMKIHMQRYAQES